MTGNILAVKVSPTLQPNIHLKLLHSDGMQPINWQSIDENIVKLIANG